MEIERFLSASFEKQTSPIRQSASIVCIRDNEVLLVRHNEKARHALGFWGFPGGKIEDGETPEHAAKRECKEETKGKVVGPLISLPGNPYRNTYVRQAQNNDGIAREKIDMYAFVCESIQGEIKDTKKNEPEWIPLSQIGEYALLPGVEQILDDALSVLTQTDHQE